MTCQKLHIGCSGFYNADWKGSLYPVESRNKDFLKLYSQVFETVEINSTFYRKPTAKTLQNWYEQTPDDFRFFIKIPKTISHQKVFENQQDEINGFCTHISNNLKKKLAGFLFQFPPWFNNSAENIKWLVNNLPKDSLIAVEFRHHSWWDEEILSIFEKENWIFCGTSFPGKLPEDVIITHPDILYYRLHGKPILYQSPYSEEFLNNLAQKILGTDKKAFIYFNNTWGNAAIENALYLKKFLQQKL